MSSKVYGAINNYYRLFEYTCHLTRNKCHVFGFPTARTGTGCLWRLQVGRVCEQGLPTVFSRAVKVSFRFIHPLLPWNVGRKCSLRAGVNQFWLFSQPYSLALCSHVLLCMLLQMTDWFSCILNKLPTHFVFFLFFCYEGLVVVPSIYLTCSFMMLSALVEFTVFLGYAISHVILFR